MVGFIFVSAIIIAVVLQVVNCDENIITTVLDTFHNMTNLIDTKNETANPIIDHTENLIIGLKQKEFIEELFISVGNKKKHCKPKDYHCIHFHYSIKNTLDLLKRKTDYLIDKFVQSFIGQLKNISKDDKLAVEHLIGNSSLSNLNKEFFDNIILVQSVL